MALGLQQGLWQQVQPLKGLLKELGQSVSGSSLSLPFNTAAGGFTVFPFTAFTTTI
jgi:hypothetical protein